MVAARLKTTNSQLGHYGPSQGRHSLPAGPLGRVDQWRGGRLRLRFHWPLIEPDLQFSRIRLSDKDSR